jgi:hypothetical protein
MNLKLLYIRFFWLIAGGTLFVTLLSGCATECSTHSMETSEVTFEDVRDMFLSRGSSVTGNWVYIVEDVTLESKEQTECGLYNVFDIKVHSKQYKLKNGELIASGIRYETKDFRVHRGISRKDFRAKLYGEE